LLVAANPSRGGVSQPHYVGLPFRRHAIHLARQAGRKLQHGRVAVNGCDGGGECAMQFAAGIAGAVEVGRGGLVDL
jgi:hypothetical protein